MATSRPFGKRAPRLADVTSTPSVEIRPAPKAFHQLRVIVRVAWRPLARVDIVGALARELICANDVAGPILPRINPDAFAIAREPCRAKVSQLAPASGWSGSAYHLWMPSPSSA